MLAPLTSRSAYFPLGSVDPDFVLAAKHHRQTKGQKPRQASATLPVSGKAPRPLGKRRQDSLSPLAVTGV